MNKTRLVLFYSWSGNTRRAARLLAERAGADLVELEPVSPYPADCAQTVRQAGREIRQGICPALRPLSLDLSGCEALFLGTPNWCGTMAPPLQSFLRQALPQGLRIAPFCTHGGGGAGRIAADLARLCAGCEVLPLLSLRGDEVSAAGPAIDRWLEQIGLAPDRAEGGCRDEA